MDPFLTRIAREADLAALGELITRSINEAQASYLTPEQIRLSHRFMGLDTQLVKDGTYFVVEEVATGRLAGCGGWSWRRTLYGGDHSAPLRDESPLNPETEPARIRAMYTHPEFQRRGVGRRILERCEKAAREAGFKRAEMMATIAGIPLYRTLGYEEIEQVIAASENGVDVPCVRMGKSL